jgi:Flp pilus assembly protein TadG
MCRPHYFFLNSGNISPHSLQKRRGQAGVSLVEFALGLIFFLTMLFGISGFGHALFAYHFVNEASKEATRYAAVRGSTCGLDGSCAASNTPTGAAGPTTIADVLAYVKTLAPQSIDSTKITTTACGVVGANKCAASTPTTCTNANPNLPGCTVEVQVNYTYNFIFPLVVTSPINMSSTSDMVISH